SRAFDLGMLAQIWRIVRRHRIDLVQAHLLTTGVYSSVLRLAKRIPVVVTFHGSFDVEAGDRFASLKTWILNAGASRLVFVSAYLRDKLLARMPLDARKAVVIHNGIDTSVFRTAR